MLTKSLQGIVIFKQTKFAFHIIHEIYVAFDFRILHVHYFTVAVVYIHLFSSEDLKGEIYATLRWQGHESTIQSSGRRSGMSRDSQTKALIKLRIIPLTPPPSGVNPRLLGPGSHSWAYSSLSLSPPSHTHTLPLSARKSQIPLSPPFLLFI